MKFIKKKDKHQERKQIRTKYEQYDGSYFLQELINIAPEAAILSAHSPPQTHVEFDYDVCVIHETPNE